MNSIKESIEEKDYFVAQLFKFMDDRGTPLNQTPVINEKDVDLYKLFKVVNNCGGYNKVGKDNQWMFISTEAGHEQQSYLTVKNFYQKYLYGFENFYRKLGCTMLNPPRKGKTRSSFSRSILRDFDKILPSTSSDKNKSVKNETNNKKNRVSTSAKKVVKAIKVEEKLQKTNEEISKNISNSISLNKQSVNQDIGEIKDSVKNFKIKNEIDTDTLNDDQIIEEEVKKEKNAKVNPTNTGLLGMKTSTTDEEQTKSFINIITVFKMSNRGLSYYQQDISSTGKSDETTEEKKNVRKKKYNKRKTSNNNTTVVNVKVETFNKNSSVNIGDNLFIQYTQNQLYESKVLEIHDFDGVMKYYIHYIGWNSRYDEWIDKNKIRFKIIEILHGPGDFINEDLSKINTLENNEKIMTVRKKKENENKTKNHISPFVNIKYEPASDEGSSEIVENNVKICYENNQKIKYDSKNPEKLKTIWKKKYDEMKISNTPSPVNIIKDKVSDEESPVTVEDSLNINYGNNQALEADVNSILLRKKTIPGSSNSMALEQYYQEDILKMIRKFNDNEVDAFLGLYTMTQSSDKPMVFMANTTEQNIEEDTNLHLNENQRHLNTHGLNELSTLEIIKTPEKSLSKRSMSNSPKQSSKRIKSSTTTVPNVPISTVNQDVILVPK